MDYEVFMYSSTSILYCGMIYINHCSVVGHTPTCESGIVPIKGRISYNRV